MPAAPAGALTVLGGRSEERRSREAGRHAEAVARLSTRQALIRLEWRTHSPWPQWAERRLRSWLAGSSPDRGPTRFEAIGPTIPAALVGAGSEQKPSASPAREGGAVHASPAGRRTGLPSTPRQSQTRVAAASIMAVAVTTNGSGIEIAKRLPATIAASADAPTWTEP